MDIHRGFIERCYIKYLNYIKNAPKETTTNFGTGCAFAEQTKIVAIGTEVFMISKQKKSTNFVNIARRSNENT